MKGHAAAFGAGALFAVGLAISGMTKPAKVAGFLDFAGAWDASLAFVMAGAVGVYAIASRVVERRTSPVFADGFAWPRRKDIDRRLVLGAGIFGVGWGLGGLCPGPSLVVAGGGGLGAIVFVVGMTAGMLVQHAFDRRVPPITDPERRPP